jgi:hypothetical protein
MRLKDHTFISRMRILRRLGETSGALTSSEKEQLDNLERQMQVLIEGGSVGKPRRAF